jgi:hypothetical protein
VQPVPLKPVDRCRLRVLDPRIVVSHRGGASRMLGAVAMAVRPATADRWSDLVTFFGRRGEDPSWCWCQRFLNSERPKSSASEAAPHNRDALYQEITHAALPPGLIAYVGDHPVGWARVGLRSRQSPVAARAISTLDTRCFDGVGGSVVPGEGVETQVETGARDRRVAGQFEKVSPLAASARRIRSMALGPRPCS